MIVEVTERDIKLGKPQEPDSCPIARSLKSYGFRDVSVGSTWTIFTIGKVEDKIRVQLPANARQFVLKFDRDRASVKPFKFVLPVRF